MSADNKKKATASVKEEEHTSGTVEQTSAPDSEPAAVSPSLAKSEEKTAEEKPTDFAQADEKASEEKPADSSQDEGKTAEEKAAEEKPSVKKNEDAAAPSSSLEGEKADKADRPDMADSAEAKSGSCDEPAAERKSAEKPAAQTDQPHSAKRRRGAERAAKRAAASGHQENEQMSAKQAENSRKRRNSRRARRKNRKKFPGKKLLIALGCAVGVLAAVYIGVSVFFMDHFFVNTQINGQDFSGKTAETVQDYISSLASNYTLTLVHLDGSTETISGSEISLAYTGGGEIEEALEAQNAFLWPQAFFAQNSSEVSVSVDYDEDALADAIDALEAVTGEQEPPTSAYIEYTGEEYVIVDEEWGTQIEKDVLVKAIEACINSFEDELVLFDALCYTAPEITADSEEIVSACETLNKYVSTSVTYLMEGSDDVVVDKELISDWLILSDDFEVSIDEDAIDQWLVEFGKTYDTVGTTRTITSPLGDTTEVSGGTYGWSIYEDNEQTLLVESIKNGETIEREPTYNKEAASHSEQDWGTTYLEVDISEQHMWYIVDGEIVLETDVVTGLPKNDRDTPTGVYSILELEEDRYLTGEIDESTGEPSYRTHVNYWMRITWSGIGFHDATWQSSFGGNRYKTNGSHGCINMPLEEAEELYNMLELGIPAIVHD